MTDANKVYVLREGHIEEDATQMQVGDRFVISTEKGEGKPQWLYEKGEAPTIWGYGFRVVGVNRFKDFQGVEKIAIDQFGDVKGRMHWDCKAEAFPVQDSNLYGLAKTIELLPYHSFLTEHGCPMKTGEEKKQVQGAKRKK